MLLQGLYRVRGKMFVPLHKVGLASHIRHGNFGEVCHEVTHNAEDARIILKVTAGRSRPYIVAGAKFATAEIFGS
jgi:hypothetical protein